MKSKVLLLLIIPSLWCGSVLADPTAEQLAQWLKQFPEADSNQDGILTIEEAQVYRSKLQKRTAIPSGSPRPFAIDPGWEKERFPEHAICYLSPASIAQLYIKVQGVNLNAIPSYPKPSDGSLRIVATGHSFMVPGFRTFPHIARAAGLQQPPLMTHTGGGITGSARYKWEQENGIFQFDRKPVPKLLASISNAQWDVMLWGPYYYDRPDFYSCWIDFCLKYNPDMKFYLMNAWPQLGQLGEIPKSEAELTSEKIAEMGKERQATYANLVRQLNEKHDNRVYIIPTCEAMVLAVEHYHRGELPGVEGIHQLVGKKERSLWRDMIGHLGPGFDQLEGYVFYASLYGRSPELIESDVDSNPSREFPSRELDRTFRKIAWQAVVDHPLTGIKDKDQNGFADE